MSRPVGPQKDPLQEKGIAHLKSGLSKEENGDLNGAFKEYGDGFAIILRCIKATNSEEKKTRLRSLMDSYMTRAEELKKKLSKGKPAVADNSESKASALVGIDPKFAKQVETEMIDTQAGLSLNDVAGLDDVKQALYEMVIFPIARPDLFTGLRSPPRGLLLFGPPGNGKTMIAKAVASHTKCTFFNVSAAALTSKYMGEGEKIVKALFAVARSRQPSIIFIDEIDSILSQRTAEDHEASRRLKTEFMIQFNTITAENCKDQVLVIGATNLPEQLDDAVVRRMTKRIFVGQPDKECRKSLITHLLAKEKHSLTKQQLSQLVDITQGYSGSDLRALCQEAAMGPVREAGFQRLANMKSHDIPKISFDHFVDAMTRVVPSVTADRLKQYEQWHLKHTAQVAQVAARGGQPAQQPQANAERRPAAPMMIDLTDESGLQLPSVPIHEPAAPSPAPNGSSRQDSKERIQVVQSDSSEQCSVS